MPDLDKPLETLEDNQNTEPKKNGHGGARPGSGRPKGKPNGATLERLEAKKALQDRIAKNVDQLFHAQMSVAVGSVMLFRVDKTEKGADLPAVQVTDAEEIKQYIDGELDTDSYYFITTRTPNNQAIDSLLDRTFGKAEQHMDLTTDGDKITQEPDKLNEILSILKEPDNEQPSTATDVGAETTGS